jgi:hypothetical protein
MLPEYSPLMPWPWCMALRFLRFMLPFRQFLTALLPRFLNRCAISAHPFPISFTICSISSPFLCRYRFMIQEWLEILMTAFPALLWRSVLNMLRYSNAVVGSLSAYKLKQSLVFIGRPWPAAAWPSHAERINLNMHDFPTMLAEVRNRQSSNMIAFVSRESLENRENDRLTVQDVQS